MTDVKLVIGPPGCGKSSFLAREVEARAEEYGGADIAVCSLTKTAAKEIGSRVDIPDQNVGTLHSHAFRALDRPDLAETPEGRSAWNTAYPDQRLTGAGSATKDELDGPGGQADDDGPGGADDLHQQVMNQRARMAPITDLPAAAQAHHQRWQDFKTQTQRLDFTDLIEQALKDTGQHPAIPRTLLGDEAQDFSALELALFRHWARAAETVVLAADPLQCQPAGTMVATRTGQVPIEQLDPAQHKLLCYCRHDNLVYGLQRGDYPFSVAWRPFVGEMTTVVTQTGERSSYTPNHRCYIKWKGDCQLLCTYLMRKGDRWRVGWCQLFKKDTGQLHFSARATLECADEAWVLKLHRDRREASANESVIAAQYGLPTIRFGSRHEKLYQTPAWTASVFDALDPEQQRERAHRLLHDHSRSPDWPLWSASDRMAKQGKRHRPVVRACNLLPEAMLLPVHGGKSTVEWTAFDVDRHDETCTVYSIDVEPHHAYVADGIATHNSIFSWRGADPHAFDRVDAAHTRVLRQSYRMSGAVHAAAVGWARSQGLVVPDYRPTDQIGQVVQSSHSLRWPEPVVQELADDGSSTVILATCSYMLGPMVAALRDAGIPFHNPLRPDHGGWNPLRSGRRLAAFLRPDERVWGDRARAWTWADLKAFCEPLNARTALTRGAKNYITQKCKTDKFGATAANDEAPFDVVASMFTEARPEVAIRHPALRMDVDWWADNLLGSQAEKMRYPLDIYRRRGGQALIETPRVAIGTVHSYKGGEADHVVLAPDLSKAAMYGGWLGTGDARDHIVRTFYVAISRARESVTVLAPSTPERVDGLLGAEQALVGAA